MVADQISKLINAIGRVKLFAIKSVLKDIGNLLDILLSCFPYCFYILGVNKNIAAGGFQNVE